VKYPEYKNLNYAEVADEILKFWKDEKIFEKSVSERSENPTFTFFEGPPSANGTPGIHHVMARAVKDIFCRFKTMQGYQVKRKGGWDTHGLPVELQVEKELGITKEDIGKKISVEEYNRKCREAVMKFKDQWDDLTEKMGYWVDLDNPYITFEPQYIETLWHLLKKLYDKDLLYKGYTIQPYSPAAGTGLSSHELNQPGCYRDVKDTTVVALFKIEGTENDYLTAWTTTPWTLPSNNSLAVGKNIIYAKVATYNPYTFQAMNVWLAKDRISAYFNPKATDLALEDYKEGDKLIPYKVLEEKRGSELVGTAYEQLMPYISLEKPAFTVLEGDFVTTEDGTGIVHLAQAFGADDYRVSVQNGVPGIFVSGEDSEQLPVVDKQGKFVAELGDLAGRYVKEEYYSEEERSKEDFRPTDVYIAIKLKEEGKAFKVEKYEHSYPHCWRTDKPILYYPLESWFIRTTAYKDELVRLNKTINWKPESTGIGRFGNWLENLVDWNLSRSRYWGTPLPIWRTEDKKEEKCIGSFEELKNEVDKAIEAGIVQKPITGEFDPHRPFVDEVILISESGQKMYREPDLIDVWFDSGAMPYAQWHWPFENKEVLDHNYPADFIAEGVDQTRGWFFTLHALAVMLFDDVAFKNVIANGLVLDKNGNKMSKRLGNAIDPFTTLAKYGPDATRWYMVTNANPWDNLKFDLEGITEVQRRFFGTLQNTYNFFALYANLDGFTFKGEAIPVGERTESDRWVLSKLNSLITEVERAFESYEPTRAGRAIQDFTVDDLSNWYVRLNRKRFWRGDYTKDKEAAYQTLYTCLETIARLSAPIAPFYMDHLYRSLNKVSGRSKEESIHLTLFPSVHHDQVDTGLEERMHKAQLVSSLVHSLRKKEKLKVRQPLSRILIPILNEHQQKQITAVEDLILSEVNIKKIEYITDTAGIVVKQIKPNFAKLGKEYGPRMKEISKAVAQFKAEDIAEIEKTNSYLLKLDGGDINLTLDDVLITSQDIPGWSVASEEDVTVALDITLTDELKQEGIARDLVNRIQNLRKDMGLEVQDKINITVERNDELVAAALESNMKYICTETQALQLDLTEELANGTLLEMDDVQVNVKVDKV
jgi:isoleucyl-tRNA synthetase